MLTLNDGRSELWQWDTGRTLAVDADCSQVHFSNKVFGRSIDVDVVDGAAVIPDILLQTDKDLNVWAFVGTAENGYTKISKTFNVNRRNKPADYVFTPPDQTTLSELVERLDKIEESQDPDAIKNAVDDYLEQNPVEATVKSVNGKTGTVELNAEDVGAIADETDPTVPDWAKQPTKPSYTAEDVGALPASTVIPTVPDNVSAFRNDAGYLTEHQDISGKLDASELPTAINTALSQAKASGEFDGPQGPAGPAGADGAPGPVGATPNIQIGTVETLAAGIPATASMGGTQENPILNLGIPQGAPGSDGSGISVTGATVGQTVKIAAVDDNGVPTAWEAVNLPSGGVTDVQLNDTSIVTDGVAAIPLANGKDVYGAVKQLSASNYCGIKITNGIIECYFDSQASGEEMLVKRVRNINYNIPFLAKGFDLMVKHAMCDTGTNTSGYAKPLIWSDAERISALLRLGCTVDDNGFVKWAKQEVSE